MIFFSLVASFILAPISSEEEDEGVAAEASRGADEDEEDAEACEGMRRSWREPSGGAERGSVSVKPAWR